MSTAEAWLPATFPEYSGPKAMPGTYFFDSHAAPVAIDHILIHGDVIVVPSSCCNHYIDNRKNALDHVSAGCGVVFKHTMQTPIHNRRRAGYDRESTSDIKKQQHFRQLMQRIPKVGYRVEPTSHVHLAQAHTRWAPQLAFPVEKIHI